MQAYLSRDASCLFCYIVIKSFFVPVTNQRVVGEGIFLVCASPTELVKFTTFCAVGPYFGKPTRPYHGPERGICLCHRHFGET